MPGGYRSVAAVVIAILSLHSGRGADALLPNVLHLAAPCAMADAYRQADAVWPTTANQTPTLVSNTFGPRQKNSESYRFDYHRGMDIPCNLGDPIFAIANGTVRINGSHSAYSDGVVQITHNFGSETFYSNYMHLNSSEGCPWVGQPVTRGQQIGTCGAGASGFVHLHFEIRESGLYQQNNVHPLVVLPWYTPANDVFEVNITDKQDVGSGRYRVNVTVTMNSEQLYLKRVEVSIDGVPLLSEVDQGGRDVRPPFLDLHSRNFQYTHRSNQWPAADCAFSSDHPASYAVNTHLDNATFNGHLISPGPFSSQDAVQVYRLEVQFELEAANVTGAPAVGDACIRANA
eukprot:Hpha_TRINITY_DN7671_c0_g1::TRINITY_DN7671_c0_g1_i1::g.19270::m.19270